jgi:hypothetical protein
MEGTAPRSIMGGVVNLLVGVGCRAGDSFQSLKTKWGLMATNMPTNDEPTKLNFVTRE